MRTFTHIHAFTYTSDIRHILLTRGPTEGLLLPHSIYYFRTEKCTQRPVKRNCSGPVTSLDSILCKILHHAKTKGFQSSHFTAWDIHKFSGPWHWIKSGLEQQAECVFRFNERYIYPQKVKLQSLKTIQCNTSKVNQPRPKMAAPKHQHMAHEKIVNSIDGSEGVTIQSSNREQKLQPEVL